MSRLSKLGGALLVLIGLTASAQAQSTGVIIPTNVPNIQIDIPGPVLQNSASVGIFRFYNELGAPTQPLSCTFWIHDERTKRQLYTLTFVPTGSTQTKIIPASVNAIINTAFTGYECELHTITVKWTYETQSSTEQGTGKATFHVCKLRFIS